MNSVKTWLALALMATSLAAQAQRPGVGSNVTLNAQPNGIGRMMLDARLYPQPSRGREPLADMQATERAIAATSKEACGFTKAEIENMPHGQKPYTFTIAELQEVPRQAVGLKGQALSENFLWARVVHAQRPSCTGWLALGQAASVQNRVEAPVAAAPTAAPAAAAPGQPPGFFCPAGWMANPSGKAAPNGTFKCFADTAQTIPAGYQCPAGFKLIDNSTTGMLTCQKG